MYSPRRYSFVHLIFSLLAAGMCLVACGAKQGGSLGSGGAPAQVVRETVTVTQQVTPAAASAAAPVVAARETAPAVPGRAVEQVAGVPAGQCSAAQLAISVADQQGAAGHQLMHLVFANISGTECALFGYPGVSAIAADGSQLGPAARRAATRTMQQVVIAPGNSAVADLDITRVGAITAPGCQHTTAAALRVYPPGETQSREVSFPGLLVCAGNVEFMDIGPVWGR